MNSAIAQQIMEYNSRVYGEISRGFDETRKAMHWTVLSNFAEQIKDGSKILDIGCGTARLLHYVKDKDIEYVGIDNVEELLSVCVEYLDARIQSGVDPASKLKTEFKLGDILDIPEADSQFDAVFAIAVLHHIPSHDLHTKAFQELARVLKKDGMLYMTNWNVWRSSYRKYIFQTWLRKARIKKPRTEWERNMSWSDFLKKWRKNQRLTYWRFYHAFTKRELCRHAREAGFEIEYCDSDHKEEIYGGKGWNWVTVARRLNNN